MTRHVALLRAVNLGSHGKIAMPVLRELLTGLGYADIETYLQSGNAVLTADETPDEVSARIEEHLAADLALATQVIVRTADELRAVIDANPLEVGDPSRFGVLFLYERAAAGCWTDGLDLATFAPDVMHPADREIYFSLPNGFGRAKLPITVGRRIKTPATMRNWRTVTALASMAGE